MKNKLQEYLRQAKTMQLATAVNDQPWVCTVYFVNDEALNLYWLSWPTRRHSQEITQNNRVAVTLALKSTLPVIGIQGEGRAEPVREAKVVENIMKIYVEKYGEGTKFYENFSRGVNQHEMYKFTADKWVLFDELNYPNEPCQQWKPKP